MNKSAVVVLLTALVAYMAAAQSSGGIPQCATKLAPCFTYLNSTTTPPTSCCDPLKEAVTNERKCLCSIYSNSALIQAFHINVTQALDLITLCHIDTVKDRNICKSVAQSPSSSSSPSAGSTPTTPGSASRSSPPGNAAVKIPGAGLAGIVSILLMFGAYTMFY